MDNGKDKSGDKRPATWYDCSLWGKRAEKLANSITKGTKLTLQGRPSAREHNGKAYLGINVDQLQFQGGGQRQDDQRQSQGYDAPPANGGGYAPSHDMEDEIPFAPEVRG